MTGPSSTVDQNLLPVQAYFDVYGNFQTFIGQGQPFYASVNPIQSGLTITNSTINSTTIGALVPSTGVFTNISTATGQISTAPSAATDIVNKLYVDTVAQGLNPKAACKAGTLTNITLSGLQTIDGYSVLAGNRVLVKNQTATADNGIYVASASAWTRAADMDVWAEVPGAYTVVLNGSQANTAWVSTSADTGTIGVTPITFVQFSGVSTYYAGTGLTLASNTFSITNTGVTAATYGTASKTTTLAINAQGQITSASAQDIAIAASQITSGTIGSSLISGSYTGITGVGTLTAGTWNATTIGVAYGGTGAATFTAGYLKASGTTAFSTVASIPSSDITGLGTMSTQNANAVAITGGTISGLSSPLAVASGGTGAATLTGYVYGNGTGAMTASTTIPNTAISGLGTMSTQNASSVAITGGTLNGVAIGGTTAGDGTFDVLTGNTSRLNTATATSLTIGTLSYTPANALITAQSSATSFNQVIISNTNNTSTTASTDYIVNNYNSTDSTYYGDFGMNGNAFTGTGAFNQANNVYLTATTADLAIGTTTANAIHFVVNGGATDAATISSAGIFSLGTALAIASGGTNSTATPTAGGIGYGTGTAYAFSAIGTTGQVLTSQGAGAPTWTTPTAYATVTDDTTTAGTRYPLFANQTAGNLATSYTSSTKYQYNPSTGVLTATGFSGSGASLTSLTAGNLSGTIPSAVLGNSTLYIGTTAVLLNAASGSITSLAVNISGSAASASTATTATNVTNVAVTDNTSSVATWYPTLVSTTTGNLPITTSSTKISFVPSTGILTSTGFAGALNGTVGATTASTGAFTTLSASSTVSGTGFSTYLASPPAIGGTAAAAVTGSNLMSSGGVWAKGLYAGTTYTDGMVMDYVSPIGRFSVGASDSFAWYNGGVGTTALMTLSSAGAIGTATWNGATIGTGYGGTGLTSFTSGGIPYATSTSALTTGSSLQFNGTNLSLGITPYSGANVYPSIFFGYSNQSCIGAQGTTFGLYTSLYYNAGWKYSTTGNAAAGFAVREGYFQWYTTGTTTGTAGGAVGTLTTSLTLNANGALVLQGGNASASGVGVTFPATQSASSDANTLDDYETGTWTPIITALVGSFTSYTCVGIYTKVGRIVTAYCSFKITDVGTGSVFCSVAGYPFTAYNAASPSVQASIASYREGGVTGANGVTSIAKNSTAGILFGTFATNSNFEFTMVYQTN